MIQVVYNPVWFYGKDLAIDLVSAFVLLLIASFSIRYYKIDKKNKNYIYLASSFFVIAISFLFKTLTNFTVYYRVLETRIFGNFVLTYPAVKASNILVIVGFGLYILLTLIGLYLLYSIHQKQSKSNIFLMLFFIVLTAYFSESEYFIFHIAALALLFLITAQYYGTYKKNRQSTSKLVTISFAIIGLSQIFSIFVYYNTIYYVIAELVQLVGYLILLATFVKVLYNAKKKG